MAFFSFPTRFRMATRRRRSARIAVETLESRDAPATMVSPTKRTYQDKDGDSVSVTFSKPILTAANVNTVFTLDSGFGAVNGNNNTEEQLQKINLMGVASAAGTTITTRAVRSPVNGGDGFAHV